MRTALVVGATGLVGYQLTKMLLNREEYSKITILVRKKLTLENPRLDQVIFDFDDPNPEVISADDIYCCLGTTIKKAGSKEGFRKVDYSYTVRIATWALKNGASKLGVISSMGADKDSRIFYNKVKGEVEETLQQLNYPYLLIFRPSMLLGERDEFRLGELIAKKVMQWFSLLIPSKYKAVHAKKVAYAMIQEMQKSKTGVRVIESDEIQEIA